MTCKYSDGKLSPCLAMHKATEYGNPRSKSKGMFLPERVNINTGERGTDIVQIHSGAYLPRGIAVEYCPFCGVRIAFWQKDEEAP